MAQQNLTLKINVAAQDAASKVQQITQAFKDLGMTFTSTDVKVNTLGQSVTHAGENFKKLGQRANLTAKQLDISGQSILGINLASEALVGTFRGLVGMWRHALDVNLELTAAQRLLKASTEDGGAAFDWVKHKAYEYGLAVSQLAHDYGIFIASAKDSSMTMKDQNYIFESMTMTASALGMSVEQSGRMFHALREMLSKNSLRSQELVVQWGSAIPGAVNRAAKAFGTSQTEFKKAMQSGAISGQVLNKWLLEFCRLLREDFEQAAREGANSLQGSLMKMKDAVELLYLEIGKGDGFHKLADSIKGFADKLREPGTLVAMRELGNILQFLKNLNKVKLGNASFWKTKPKIHIFKLCQLSVLHLTITIKQFT